MKNQKSKISSASHEETVLLGEKIAKELKNGDIVGLIGELGAGKTTMVKGIACGLGVSDGSNVKSPSFIIHSRFVAKDRILNHLDFYRIKNENELEGIGFRDIISSDAITVIEWCDLVPSVEKECNILIRIEFEGEKRKIIIERRKV